MKFNLLPICMTLLLVACNQGKEVKILDGGASISTGPTSAVPVISPSSDKPAPEASPEAIFCDKGQTYNIDMTIADDFMDYEGKIWTDVATFKKKKAVKIYFQDGQVTEKDRLDKNKVFCEITAYINPHRKDTYKIAGLINSSSGEEKVEHRSACREKLIDTSHIINGEGIFSEIACTKTDDSKLRVEDVKDAMGENNIKISGTSL